MAAWAIGGATIGSAIIGGIGAKKAADAGQEGAANAIAEEGRQFDLQWNAQSPYREAGGNALAKMALLTGSPDPRVEAYNDRISQIVQDFRANVTQGQEGPARTYLANLAGADTFADATDEQLIGLLTGDALNDEGKRIYGQYGAEINSLQSDLGRLGGDGTPSNADIAEMVKQDPSYQFRFDEGQNALENYMSGKSRWSGNALRGISDYGQSAASQEYGNIFNRNSTIARLGPSATQTPQNDISAYMANQGTIQADKYGDYANVANNAVTNWVSYDQNQKFLNALNPPAPTSTGFTGSNVHAGNY